MSEFILRTSTDAIATITLNRPDKRNALHGPMVKEFIEVLKILAKDDSRLLLIHGAGTHFCAGGDIEWMKKMAQSSRDENEDDAQNLADLLFNLYHFPKPTIALVHGAAMGGGMGLLAACDIAIASRETQFAFPEVKMGLTPSIVSPYVIAAMGERQAHYYFLTGEKFSVEAAKHLGLIQQITAESELMSAGMMLAKQLLENSKEAMQEVKKLIPYVAKEKITQALSQKTAEHLASIRQLVFGEKEKRNS